MHTYWDWLKDHWQKSAVLVLIYTLAGLVPLYSKLALIDFMLLLSFPLYLVHEIEEYILPGGFPEFFNEHLLTVKSDDKIVPIDRDVIFWVNFIYIWLLIPSCVALGVYNLIFAAWIPYFFFFQAVSHLAMGIKGKMIFNPSIRSSFLLHVPYSVFVVHLLGQKDVFVNPYFNRYMVIGLALNLMLPLMARFVVMPRYRRKVR